MATLLTVTGNPSTYATGNWPAAEMNGGVWEFTFTFTASSAGASYSGFNSLFCGPVGGGGTTGGLFIVNNSTIELYDIAADAQVFARAMTWGAGATGRFKIDAVAQTITISGMATGNGTFSFTQAGPYFDAAATITAGGVTGQPGFTILGAFGNITDGVNSVALASVSAPIAVGDLGLLFARRAALDSVSLALGVGDFAVASDEVLPLASVAAALAVGDLGLLFDRIDHLDSIALALGVGALSAHVGALLEIGEHAVDAQPFPFSERDALLTLDTQVTGSVVLLSSAGNSADVTQAWTASGGNTVRKLGAVLDYPDFPGYGSQLGITVPPMAGGAGQTFTMQVSDEDENTSFAVEIIGGHRVRFIQAAIANAGVGPTVSIGPLTVDDDAVLIAFWDGSSPVSPPFSGSGGPGGGGVGAPFTAVPDGDFVVLRSYLNNFEFGEVQRVMAGQVVGPGAYSVTWTATPTQGALLWLAAVMAPLVLELESASGSLGVGDLTLHFDRIVTLDPVAVSGVVGDLSALAGRVAALAGVAVSPAVGDLVLKFARRAALDSTTVSIGAGDLDIALAGALPLGPSAVVTAIGDLALLFARRVTLDSIPVALGLAGVTVTAGTPGSLLTLHGSLGLIGQMFGLLQLVGGTLIDLIGPLRIFAGDTATIRITVTDDEDRRVDLTSATIELQVKPTIGGPDPATIAKSVGAGIVLLDQGVAATKGQADCSIASVDTAIAPRLYWLDVVVGIAGGRSHVVAPREFTVRGVVNAP